MGGWAHFPSCSLASNSAFSTPPIFNVSHLIFSRSHCFKKMTLKSSWATISRVFNPNNPYHVHLHAKMMATSETEDEILKLKSLLSPLRRFPPDLLAKIFVICVANEPFTRLDSRTAPWVLGKVCSRWRAIALSTPSLWSEIDISLDPYDAKFCLWRPAPKHIVHIVRLALQRSGNHPLIVKVSCETHLDAHPALELLMAESHRWADVELYMPAPLLLTLAPIQRQVQSLRTLDIFLYRLPGGSDEGRPILEAFKTAPLLRRFSIGDDCDTSMFVDLPWEQLTSYSSQAEDFFLRSLRRMQNLVVCRIDPHYYSIGPQKAIHLPHLRTLSIAESNEPLGHAGDFLDCLTLPNLDTLEIECKNGAVLPHLTALVTRSSCPLQTFSLTMSDPVARVASEALEFFKRTPALEDLTLAAAVLMPEFVNGLARDAGTARPGVLPALHTLDVDAAFMTQGFLRMVRSRVQSRSDVTPGLMVLEITGVSDHLAREGLFRMKELGVDVKVWDLE
ncbi:hypothetical protein FB451DRAFT_589278 [Mycena latifolia]|nr:hypothetical protein FB451DRAFT_589278 [Mycena latifolia]